MINKTLSLFAAALLALAACTHSLTPEALNGNWHYVKIDHPNGDDMTDTVPADTLIAMKPLITFSKGNQLQITWNGKVLSHGSFTISGDKAATFLPGTSFKYDDAMWRVSGISVTNGSARITAVMFTSAEVVDVAWRGKTMDQRDAALIARNPEDLTIKPLYAT